MKRDAEKEDNEAQLPLTTLSRQRTGIEQGLPRDQGIIQRSQSQAQTAADRPSLLFAPLENRNRKTIPRTCDLLADEDHEFGEGDSKPASNPKPGLSGH